jgi:hypothetical protein
MEHSSHLPSFVIRKIADGTVMPEPSQLWHMQQCDECSDLWWRMKQEAKRERDDDLFSDRQTA